MGGPHRGVGGLLQPGVRSLAWIRILEIAWALPTYQRHRAVLPTVLKPPRITVVSFLWNHTAVDNGNSF